MNHSPIRQTFELGKFISTAGKSILNLVKLESFVENIIKCGKYSHVKFAILYTFLLRAEMRHHISKLPRYHAFHYDFKR